MSVRQRADSMK